MQAETAVAPWRRLVDVAGRLHPSDLAALADWEDENLGLGLGTSDWPGWTRYLDMERFEQRAAPPRAARTPKRAIPTALRWAVYERDDFRCVDCGSRRDLTCDHVIPESKGGLTTIENLTTRCRSCNSRKGVRL